VPGFVRSLDHVQLAIPQGGEDLGRAFYVGVLQFVEIEKPARLRVRGGCWLQSGDALVHLGVEASFIPAKKAHPAFRVHDLTGLAAALSAAGYPFTFDHEIDGVARGFTHDPFGNRIEFIGW